MRTDRLSHHLMHSNEPALRKQDCPGLSLAKVTALGRHFLLLRQVPAAKVERK